MSKPVIIENMSEIAAGTRGASLGMGALKVAARNKNSEYFGQYPITFIRTENYLLDQPTEFKFAKRIDGLVNVYNRAAETISDTLKNGNFPICISGDHACAGGTISGIKKAYPEKRLGVIWIDAHADLHTPYTTPSGNLHGMPLAAALGTNNMESQINNPSEEAKKLWEELKNCAGIAPKVKPEDIVFIAVRDTEEPENELMNRENIKNYSVKEIREKGCKSVINEINEKLSQCDIIYVSFDVDSMDCDLISKGTGTPVPDGLTAEEANLFVNGLVAHEKCVCFEVVEINPCLDNKINTMAETAFEILEAATKTIENK